MSLRDGATLHRREMLRERHLAWGWPLGRNTAAFCLIVDPPLADVAGHVATACVGPPEMAMRLRRDLIMLPLSCAKAAPLAVLAWSPSARHPCHLSKSAPASRHRVPSVPEITWIFAAAAGGLYVPLRSRTWHLPADPPPPPMAGVVPVPEPGTEVSLPPLPPTPQPLHVAPGTVAAFRSQSP